MVKYSKFSAIALALGLAIYSYSGEVSAAKYEVVTSTRAMVARDTLANIDFSGLTNVAPNANTEMYSPDKMNSIIENSRLAAVVRDQDRCQFTADIEDRARIVKVPVFMYAWGQMLMNGICVREDKELGLGYIRHSADDGYAPAMMQMSVFYERGSGMGKSLNMSEQYMHTAAALGSKTARLNWADMLVRGFGSPIMYEEAYGWLYHCDFDDEYSKAKKLYLQEQLKKFLPPNVVARNEAFAPDF